MNHLQPRYSPEVHARLGMELYDGQVRRQVETGNDGKIVAIDVDSGDFELGDDSVSACQSVLARHPNAQIWCVRIGHPAVHRFGFGTQGTRA